MTTSNSQELLGLNVGDFIFHVGEFSGWASNQPPESIDDLIHQVKSNVLNSIAEFNLKKDLRFTERTHPAQRVTEGIRPMKTRVDGQLTSHGAFITLKFPSKPANDSSQLEGRDARVNLGKEASSTEETSEPAEKVSRSAPPLFRLVLSSANANLALSNTKKRDAAAAFGHKILNQGTAHESTRLRKRRAKVNEERKKREEAEASLQAKKEAEKDEFEKLGKELKEEVQQRRQVEAEEYRFLFDDDSEPEIINGTE